MFWGLVAVLFGASGAFAVGAERQRQAITVAEVDLKTGDLVELERVVDGDSVVVKNAEGKTVPVRIVGIKAFRPDPEGDASSKIGREAIATLTKLAAGEPLRVQLAAEPKDAHGRTLATLYVAGEDIGMRLVASGLALVYTVYPFPAMPIYLSEQHGAQSDGRGLWGDPGLSKRAEVLTRQWERAER